MSLLRMAPREFGTKKIVDAFVERVPVNKVVAQNLHLCRPSLCRRKQWPSDRNINLFNELLPSSSKAIHHGQSFALIPCLHHRADWVGYTTHQIVGWVLPIEDGIVLRFLSATQCFSQDSVQDLSGFTSAGSLQGRVSLTTVGKMPSWPLATNLPIRALMSLK